MSNFLKTNKNEVTLSNIRSNPIERKMVERRERERERKRERERRRKTRDLIITSHRQIDRE